MVLIKMVMDLSNQFIATNKQNIWETQRAINSMIPCIDASFGAKLSKEIEVLLTNTSSMFEENFGYLRNRFDSVDNGLQEIKGAISAQILNLMYSG